VDAAGGRASQTSLATAAYTLEGGDPSLVRTCRVFLV